MKARTSSVDKTFAILENFTVEKPEWSITELAQVMESNKSTVYRFLSDMQKRGAMYQNPNTGKYGLGLKLFELGNRVPIKAAFVDKTHPVLAKVSKNITETVHIAILKDKQTYYVDKVVSPQGLTVNTSIGDYIPLHCTSLGKVLLAYSYTDYASIITDEVLDNTLLAFTTKTITNQDVLAKELKKIRQQGFAIDNEEYEIGLICVGVPIFNANNEIVASLSAAGPANRFKKDQLNNYVAILKEGAEEIKNNIGNFKM